MPSKIVFADYGDKHSLETSVGASFAYVQSRIITDIDYHALFITLNSEINFFVKKHLYISTTISGSTFTKFFESERSDMTNFALTPSLGLGYTIPLGKLLFLDCKFAYGQDHSLFIGYSSFFNLGQ